MINRAVVLFLAEHGYEPALTATGRITTHVGSDDLVHVVLDNDDVRLEHRQKDQYTWPSPALRGWKIIRTAGCSLSDPEMLDKVLRFVRACTP